MKSDSQELTTYSFDTRIICKPGMVQIIDFEETLKKAEIIRDYFKTVEVTPESIQTNKKLLARLNKAFDVIDTGRKQVKKEFMAPFTEVDEQCKELKAIVTEANESIRSQIRVLEEIERDEKEAVIKEIWDKRVERLDVKPFLSFERFLKPQHLNKSISMNKVEKAMAEFIKSEQETFDALKVFCETNDYDFSYALTLYNRQPSLSSVMILLDKEERDRQKSQKIIDEILEPPEQNEQTEQTDKTDDLIAIYVHEKDFERVAELLLQNNISAFSEYF